MEFSASFPHDVDAIPAARRALDRFAPELDELTMRNARLIVSELVTNVVRHVPAGTGDIELRVACEQGELRIEVADHGPGFTPEPQEDFHEASSGWGLHILARTASRWGVEHDGANRVWCEMPALHH